MRFLYFLKNDSNLFVIRSFVSLKKLIIVLIIISLQANSMTTTTYKSNKKNNPYHFKAPTSAMHKPKTSNVQNLSELGKEKKKLTKQIFL